MFASWFVRDAADFGGSRDGRPWPLFGDRRLPAANGRPDSGTAQPHTLPAIWALACIVCRHYCRARELRKAEKKKIKIRLGLIDTFDISQSFEAEWLCPTLLVGPRLLSTRGKLGLKPCAAEMRCDAPAAEEFHVRPSLSLCPQGGTALPSTESDIERSRATP